MISVKEHAKTLTRIVILSTGTCHFISHIFDWPGALTQYWSQILLLSRLHKNGLARVKVCFGDPACKSKT
jgi:hypothetical protein